MKKVLASIAFRLPAAIAALCVAVAGTITYFGYAASVRQLEVEAGQRLEMALEVRHERIADWLGHVVRDVSLARANPAVATAMLNLKQGWDAIEGDAQAELRRLFVDGNPHPAAARDRLETTGDSGAYSQAHARVHAQLRDLRDGAGFQDLMLFDGLGQMVYSVAKAQDFAAGPASVGPAGASLVAAVRAVGESASQAPVLVDFAPYLNAEPAAFLVSRIDGRQGGVLVARLGLDELTRIVSSHAGLGETGEVDLIGQDGLLRAGSGHRPALKALPPSQLLTIALDGHSGALPDATGLDGQPATAAIGQIREHGLTWTLIGTQNHSELLVAADRLRNQMLQIMLLAIGGALLLGGGLAFGLTRRLSRVGTAMAQIAAGQHETPVNGSAARDEIGGIARSLESFRERLAEAAAGARMTLFRSRAFANSSVAMMMVDREGTIIEVNGSTTDMFTAIQDDLRKRWPGFDGTRLVGQKIDQFHRNPAHQRGLINDPSRLPLSTEVSIGDLRLQVNVSAILDDGGQLVGAIAEWKDVRALRMNESVLEAMRRSRIMTEYAGDFRILSTNDVFSKVFGLQAADANGHGFADVFSTTEDTRALKEKLMGGQAISYSARRSTRAGREVALDVTMCPVFDGRGQIDRVVEISTDVTAIEAERTAIEEERRQSATAQRRVVEDLKRGLSGLAEGNLTLTIEEPFSEEYDQLRHDFNAALGRLTEVMARLISTTGNINSGAVEMSQAADDLSHRTENQAATLEETAAALDELTASVKSAAEGAGEADRAVRSARENAEASGQVVLQAVAAMSEIEKSSDQISQIIGVIDDIAFQTNLLALNAGVEAARAGEAGRGFAVVASEVRSLAQRSSEAAKEIKVLISASSDHVGRGVSLVGQTGEALKRIVESVAHIAGLVSEIAASSVEQSTGLSEINTGVNQLDEVTQQNAAMVEETTAASHSLKQEAESLTQLVSMFRVRQGTGAEIVGFAGSRRESPPRTESGNRPASKRTGTSDGWEDF